MGALNHLKSPMGHSAWDYAQSAIDLLHGIRLDIQDGNGIDPLPRRIPFSILCDASGNGQVELPISRGKKWDLMRIAYSGSTSGFLNTFVNGTDATGLLLVTNSGLWVSQEYTKGDVVTGQDAKLVIVAGAQVANTAISGNIALLQYDEVVPKNATN